MTKFHNFALNNVQNAFTDRFFAIDIPHEKAYCYVIKFSFNLKKGLFYCNSIFLEQSENIYSTTFHYNYSMILFCLFNIILFSFWLMRDFKVDVGYLPLDMESDVLIPYPRSLVTMTSRPDTHSCLWKRWFRHCSWHGQVLISHSVYIIL